MLVTVQCGHQHMRVLPIYLLFVAYCLLNTYTMRRMNLKKVVICIIKHLKYNINGFNLLMLAKIIIEQARLKIKQHSFSIHISQKPFIMFQKQFFQIQFIDFEKKKIMYRT